MTKRRLMRLTDNAKSYPPETKSDAKGCDHSCTVSYCCIDVYPLFTQDHSDSITNSTQQQEKTQLAGSRLASLNSFSFIPSILNQSRERKSRSMFSFSFVNVFLYFFFLL